MAKDDYLVIPAGVYRVGIEKHRVRDLCARVASPGVKSRYLRASTPSHDVEIATVAIATSPVTRGEFAEFAAETGYRTESEREGWGWVCADGRWRKRDGVNWRTPFAEMGKDLLVSDDAMPVMQTSWNDAAAYCGWRSGKTGTTVRLPREAEWEIFASLCGVAGMDEIMEMRRPMVMPEDFADALAGVRENGPAGTGRLWEWTGDWYSAYPGGDENEDFGRVYRVLKGGSLLSLPIQQAREYRLRKCPTARSPYYGFRIAVVPNAGTKW
ncbi:MAG: SUMF1/EgtB/PvdO family nonheme iron enzyme [Spirochaetes bacterium]|nr:SUMF1/EgtB/PvdO family nonheme iron enzyme [Spirochaetota bacterium]